MGWVLEHYGANWPIGISIGCVTFTLFKTVKNQTNVTITIGVLHFKLYHRWTVKYQLLSPTRLILSMKFSDWSAYEYAGANCEIFENNICGNCEWWVGQTGPDGISQVATGQWCSCSNVCASKSSHFSENKQIERVCLRWAKHCDWKARISQHKTVEVILVVWTDRFCCISFIFVL